MWILIQNITQALLFRINTKKKLPIGGAAMIEFDEISCKSDSRFYYF